MAKVQHSKKQAILVVGLHRSGVRMFMESLNVLGVPCSFGENQKYDKGFKDASESLLAHHFVFKPGQALKDVRRPLRALRNQGYDVRIAAIHRDPRYLVASHVAYEPHKAVEFQVENDYALTYLHILTDLFYEAVPFTWVKYSMWVKNHGYRQAILQDLRVPNADRLEEHTMFFNANRNHEAPTNE